MNTEPTTEMMNEVIRQFIGLEPYEDSKYGTLYSSPADGKTCFSLQYHTSWDWLMPVVEKIHGLAVAGDAINAITEEAIFTFSIFAPLKDVHRAVYQFITWYNDNQQKQTNGSSSES